MKRILTIASILIFSVNAFGGGLLTNTNQSAQFIRMMSRNASTGIDAVYFNPAGLTTLENGWHFAINSQTILQTKPVNSKFPLLNDGYYDGTVNVPVFPTGFAVYKMDQWAFSFGVGPNAGGGSAVYERGLPSFEIPVSKVVPGLAGLRQINPGLDVTSYDVDIAFEGSSVFWGIQLGATYQVNDIFSLYGGVRYLPAKNTYVGDIKNIRLQVGEQYYPAPEWLTQTATQLQGMAANAGSVAGEIQPLITQGAGELTLEQVQNAGYISEPQRTAIEQGLTSLGATNPGAMNMNQIHQTFSGAQQQLSTAGNQLSGTAGLLGDKHVDTEQTGSGITPMIGVNISPVENLNLALKYEMKTSLSLENKPNANDNYSSQIFGDAVSNDLPAILGLGAGYTTGLLEAQLSYNMYFNKGVNWGANIRNTSIKREIDRNGMEIGVGLQFNVLDNFAFSVGGLYGDQGVAESYQSDFSYSNPSVTAGAGIEWKITPAFKLDAGFSNTFYQDQTVTFTDPDAGNYSEVYEKTTLNFAIGLSYSIFK
ncbi:MAG TPA: hypothetical protein VFD91_12030 [Mariniphaga sp.]|nr:hypothetical protein [Mariniphaga sp.]